MFGWESVFLTLSRTESSFSRPLLRLVRTQSLNVLPLKPAVGQYIAIYATLTARDFFLAYFYPSGPFTCIFSKTSPDCFPVFAVANIGFCVGPKNMIGHPAGYRFPCLLDTGSRVECSRNINRLKNMTCGMMTCEMNNLEIEWSLCSALM